MNEPGADEESPGRAKRAWHAWSVATNALASPLVSRVVGDRSASTVTDLVGFWLVWHLHGGFDGMITLGMTRSTVFRRIKLFQEVYGAHPDDFVMPGVEIDVATYLQGPAPIGEAAEDV